MAFSLPKLPYAPDALEPYISEKTLEYHYGKHHQAYVNNLNNLIVGTEFENATLEEIVLKSGGGIFNNGAQIWNHTFYFYAVCRLKDATSQKVPIKKAAIECKIWLSSKPFKEDFLERRQPHCLARAGPGWLDDASWRTRNWPETSNAANPMCRRQEYRLLTCDVWEHAYYIDKKNARPAYIEDFWKIVDWKVISERF